MATAIKVDRLSKQYLLGGEAKSDSLREIITQLAKNPFQSRLPRTDGATTLWALQDLSFEIGEGEVVGIIGRNGAGKSTLLKILSRITPPTGGEVHVFGSMASLLEVGTGFHPELTGRENIYLNGSILGMSHAVIRKHFDEIVAFADIGRFLDTPVKHYSSGMYIRLAFAVAAHLDSDILLLDEVLAVGDVAFQKRCLAKMDDISGKGRTVLFVSHSMTSIRQLCTRCILIDHGRIIDDGPTARVLRSYSEKLRTTRLDSTTHLKERSGGHSGAVRFSSFRVEDAAGIEKYDFKKGETIRIHVTYQVRENVPNLCLYFAFTSDTSGETLTSVRYVLSETPLAAGHSADAIIEFPNVPLMPREYHPYVWLGGKSGLAYDRINYYLTACPPVIISNDEQLASHDTGYFAIPSRLIS